MRLQLTGLTPVRLDDSSRTSIRRSVICSYPYRHMQRNLERALRRKGRGTRLEIHTEDLRRINQASSKERILQPVLARTWD